MPEKKLTPAQAGRLGGLRSAALAGRAGMARLGARGGNATLAAHGAEHMTRLSHQRWGRLQKTSNSEKPNAAGISGGVRVHHQSRDERGDSDMIPARGAGE